MILVWIEEMRDERSGEGIVDLIIEMTSIVIDGMSVELNRGMSVGKNVPPSAKERRRY
jgi:hypothetical protein